MVRLAIRPRDRACLKAVCSYLRALREETLPQLGAVLQVRRGAGVLRLEFSSAVSAAPAVEEWDEPEETSECEAALERDLSAYAATIALLAHDSDAANSLLRRANRNFLRTGKPRISAQAIV